MIKRNPPIKIYINSFALILMVVALYIGNAAFVKNNTGGLDFLAHWQGARAFTTDGINPYSDQSASLINSKMKESFPDLTDNYRFVTPFFSLIFLAPVSLIADFAVARTIWMTMLEAMLLLGGYVISRWVGRGKSILVSLVVILMVLLNYSIVYTLLNGGLAIVSFTLVICGIHFLLKKQDEAAGLMLALSLVKPDMVYPILLILIVWVIVTRRLTVFWWFLATFVLVMGFSMVLIPNWPVDYLRSVIEYSARNPVRMTALAPTALEIRFLLVKNLAIALLIIYEWFVVKTRGSQRFLWTSGLLLAVSPWIGGTTSLAHTILIIPALFIGIGYLGGSRKEKSSLWMLLIPLLLGLSSWLFSGMLVSGISEAWQNNWLKVVVPLVVLVILYWSRWWVIRNEKFSQAHFTLS